MLDYDKQERGDVTIFSLKGNLDALTAPALKKEIEALLAARRINVVFDLSGLELIDSSGVGAIVSLFKPDILCYVSASGHQYFYL
jgi:anti-sigma B factor antagonist